MVVRGRVAARGVGLGYVAWSSSYGDECKPLTQLPQFRAEKCNILGNFEVSTPKVGTTFQRSFVRFGWSLERPDPDLRGRFPSILGIALRSPSTLDLRLTFER
jgi:hypothetical protein